MGNRREQHQEESAPQRLPPLDWKPEHEIVHDTVVIEVQRAIGMNNKVRRSIRVSRRQDGKTSAFLRPSDLPKLREAIELYEKWDAQGQTPATAQKNSAAAETE